MAKFTQLWDFVLRQSYSNFLSITCQIYQFLSKLIPVNVKLIYLFFFSLI